MTVVEGLLKAFQRNLDSDEKPINELATKIESALFEHHSHKTDSHYRMKYRSLLHNLGDPKNIQLRHRLLTGSLEPVILVQMSSADLATEEMTDLFQKERQRSLSQAILRQEEEDDGSAKKKTHKGEELVVLREESVPETPQYFSPKVAADPLPPKALLLWTGRLIWEQFCNVPLQVEDPACRRLPCQLPHNLHVSGRIDPTKALAYLNQISALPNDLRSREILLLELSPRETATAESTKLQSYLADANRWAVIAHDPAILRDLYVAPGRVVGLGDGGGAINNMKYRYCKNNYPLDPAIMTLIVVYPRRPIKSDSE